MYWYKYCATIALTHFLIFHVFLQLWYYVIKDVLVWLSNNTFTQPTCTCTMTKMNPSQWFHHLKRLRDSHQSDFAEVSWPLILAAIVIFSTGGLLIFKARNHVLSIHTHICIKDCLFKMCMFMYVWMCVCMYICMYSGASLKRTRIKRNSL